MCVLDFPNFCENIGEKNLFPKKRKREKISELIKKVKKIFLQKKLKYDKKSMSSFLKKSFLIFEVFKNIKLKKKEKGFSGKINIFPLKKNVNYPCLKLKMISVRPAFLISSKKNLENPLNPKKNRLNTPFLGLFEFFIFFQALIEKKCLFGKYFVKKFELEKQKKRKKDFYKVLFKILVNKILLLIFWVIFWERKLNRNKNLFFWYNSKKLKTNTNLRYPKKILSFFDFSRFNKLFLEVKLIFSTNLRFFFFFLRLIFKKILDQKYFLIKNFIPFITKTDLNSKNGYNNKKTILILEITQGNFFKKIFFLNDYTKNHEVTLLQPIFFEKVPDKMEKIFFRKNLNQKKRKQISFSPLIPKNILYMDLVRRFYFKNFFNSNEKIQKDSLKNFFFLELRYMNIITTKKILNFLILFPFDKKKIFSQFFLNISKLNLWNFIYNFINEILRKKKLNRSNKKSFENFLFFRNLEIWKFTFF